jgi:hypothetical protein
LDRRRRLPEGLQRSLDDPAEKERWRQRPLVSDQNRTITQPYETNQEQLGQTTINRSTFIDPDYWFRPSASYFLFARAKEKVTKEKARPTSGFRCAQLPSFRRCSEGRQDGPSMAQHASFGILPNAPLRNTCTRPPDGGIWTESFGRFLNALSFAK